MNSTAIERGAAPGFNGVHGDVCNPRQSPTFHISLAILQSTVRKKDGPRAARPRVRRLSPASQCRDLTRCLCSSSSCILEFLVKGVVTTGALVGRSNHRCCCACELLLLRSMHRVPLHLTGLAPRPRSISPILESVILPGSLLSPY